MAAAATAAGTRRRKIIGHRRRLEDEGEEEANIEVPDADDDSLTEGSIGSDDNDPADDSDTSNVDEVSPTMPNAQKLAGNGIVKPSLQKQLKQQQQQQQRQQQQSPGQPQPQQQQKEQQAKDQHVEGGGAEGPKAIKTAQATLTDTEIMLNGLSIADHHHDGQPVQEINFDELHEESVKQVTPPVVVSSSGTPAPPSAQPPLQDRRRQEHEAYRRRRDEDPSFVPNRGSFFMHDHRHPGPAANGFRPFGRGGRGRGRGGFAGGMGPTFAPIGPVHPVADPTTNAPWAHDMHETVIDTIPRRQVRHLSDVEGPANGDGFIPTAQPSPAPINRAMSTEKHVNNAIVRVLIPPMKTPVIISSVPVKQYTKLPDHRPPLRRDKPVRISLPYHDPPLMPRYILPAHDRSFIFIPRAMRPNQQRLRGKGPRSTLGSIGGFSRRTSVFGGSYYGSGYSPSIALSRRSSIAPDMGRDFIISPTGSAISRPPLPVDNTRPVVRLPPLAQANQVAAMPARPHEVMAMPVPPVAIPEKVAVTNESSSISDLPPPQTHPLPQKPIFQEVRPNTLPMHQPRPQKTVSVENIETPVPPTNDVTPSYPSAPAFHQQVPMPISNTYAHDSHIRRPSYPIQHSTGTPLSQIPERAIHAAPFQPTAYSQPGFYGQPYQMMPPQPGGYYYPPQGYNSGIAPNAGAQPFVPAVQEGQPASYNQAGPTDATTGQTNGHTSNASRLISQNINGTVYYFDPSQIPAMAGYPPYPGAQPYAPGLVGMPGMMTPSQDGYYYPQPAPGMVPAGPEYAAQYGYQQPAPGMVNYSQ